MKPASNFSRIFAHLIDTLIFNGVDYLFSFGLEKIAAAIGAPLSFFTVQVVGAIFGLIFGYGYYVEYQLKMGATPGKAVFKIQVVDYQSELPMNRRQAIIRYLAYLPSYLILFCGFFMAFFNRERRALHDQFAGTWVVTRDSGPKVPGKKAETH